jgi:hypothetical protein
MSQAEQQQRLLLIYFYDLQNSAERARFETESLAAAAVREKLARDVCLRLPLEATIPLGGRPVRLLDHPAFAEMLGRPGVAIVDLAHRDAPYYGAVVSTFPFRQEHVYSADRLATILDLPAGTLTQRTLIYAVRVHPEQPASTQGQLDGYLLQEAEGHAQYQASIRVQGHQGFDARFQRIVAHVPGSVTAGEVCAESWPGDRLVDAAIECVRCWRLSPGHWNAVRSFHPWYGYDMKVGSNGIWYATGIFAENR